MTLPLPGAPIEISIENAASLSVVRRQLGETSRGLGFGLVEHTKLITAASELTRNIIDHADFGKVIIEILVQGSRSGIRLTFEDRGKGIPDIDRAMQDGYTSGKGMGMGLPGTKRLVHEFSIESEDGLGTRVVIVIWKR